MVIEAQSGKIYVFFVQNSGNDGFDYGVPKSKNIDLVLWQKKLN